MFRVLIHFIWLINQLQTKNIKNTYTYLKLRIILLNYKYYLVNAINYLADKLKGRIFGKESDEESWSWSKEEY